MKRAYLLIPLLLLCSACACALDDEDRAAGKPPIWQCFVANSLRAVACRTGTTDAGACPITPANKSPDSSAGK